MKKLGFYILMLALGSSLLYSCEDPYANQVVAAPGSYDQKALTDTSFVATASSTAVTLTEATAADSTVVLTVNTIIPSISGATAKYDLQIANNAAFTNAYHRLYTKKLASGSKVKILNSDLNMILDSMNLQSASTIYARLVASVSVNGTLLTQKSYSAATGTTASLSITPYSLLKPYTTNTPRLWYMVGSAIGDGNWNNSVAGLGASLYPLSIVSGNAYNKSGDGTFVYTGYFLASKEFKLIRDIGSWTEQWGMSGSNYVHNDGGAGNIKVATDGWYTVTLNSVKNTLTVVATSAPATSYNSMGIIGDVNGWGGDIAMTKGASTNSHIWYTTYTFAGAPTQGVKFRANAAWTASWGSAAFPYGISTGDNIMYTAGTYTAVLNDVDGTYYFIIH